MKLSPEELKILKSAPNSAYTAIMPVFLFYSNKLEGSTFSVSELERLAFEGIVEGEHTLDDVLETRNSIDVFDYIVDTLDEAVTETMLYEMNRMLFKGTADESAGFTGHYKTIANRIRNSSVQVASPSDIPLAMPKLLHEYGHRPLSFEEVVDFHVRFEHLHPFQNGNGRIGRFLMLKQCIESGLDLIVVDDDIDKPYEARLEHAQAEGDPSFLYALMHECQERFDAKMEQMGVTRLIEDMRRVAQSAKTAGCCQ